MTKILVVDDEADLEVLIRQKFRQKIRAQQYQFVFAINGRHALEQLRDHPDVEVVLSDINMPEMDGLTLLSKIKEQNSLLKSVVVSAYGDMANIRIAMNRGAFDFITKPVNFEDLEITIERTIEQVQQSRKTLQALKENNILRLYVDENVLKFMGSREFEASFLESETVLATVAFIDICSFTSLSEKESPEIVVKLLNDYFDLFAKEIIAQNGVIDKFIGDCVMAVFKGPNHLEEAIETSLAIRNKLEEFPPTGSNNDFKAKITVGINSGEMVSGNIGSSTLRRLDYTVIGDTVNTAQRLQSIARPGQILITEASFEQVNSSFSCQKIGPTLLKNKAAELTLYEVLD
jgi:class 3 adenylate cyclase/AmiR/NasT family two-component response regulator